MIDLLKSADPALDLETDRARLRAKVEERIGISVRLQPIPRRPRRGWLIAFGTVGAVIALSIPVIIRFNSASVFEPDYDVFTDLPGVERVVELASGGVQTMAVDGTTIWVMTALQGSLQRVSAASGQIEAVYDISGHVEGVVVGGGYVWLLNYDNGGEVLRFNPDTEAVDVRVVLDGVPSHGAVWFGDRLWVSTDERALMEISPAGQVLSVSPGELKGEGFGYLWINDPANDLITSLAADGSRGDIVIPTFSGLETMSGSGVRSVAVAGDYLWLMDGDFPWGTNLSRFNPSTGDLQSFDGLTFGLLGMVEADGYLWVTSNTDQVLFRINPSNSDVRRYPLPGKPGGLSVVDGKLWAAIYQPGTLIQIDPNEELVESAEVVFDDWDQFPHRLLCTGPQDAVGPTIILEPFDWIEYGSWAVVQAELSNQGYLVCANGYVQGEASPAQRAADLEQALMAGELPGPYILVAAGDGVHTIRLFAEGRSDISGVVLVDPMPIGFQTAYDALAPTLSGHPPWSDIDPELSSDLDDFGEIPLVVIGQDPEAVYLSRRFTSTVGRDVGDSANQLWQDGLAFYAGLSTNSKSLVASGTGLDGIIRDQLGLVVQHIVEIANGQG